MADLFRLTKYLYTYVLLWCLDIRHPSAIIVMQTITAIAEIDTMTVNATQNITLIHKQINSLDLKHKNLLKCMNTVTR